MDKREETPFWRVLFDLGASIAMVALMDPGFRWELIARLAWAREHWGPTIRELIPTPAQVSAVLERGRTITKDAAPEEEQRAGTDS